MKRTIGVVLGAVLLLVAGWCGHSAYLWKQSVDRRMAVTERAVLYLFAPTELRDEHDGHPLRRVDLLDRALASAMRKQ